jgi:DNA-binding CsgD family transcriptional regulator
LTHLIEVQFASGALADAEQTAKQLTDLAQAAQNDLLLAQIELIQGQMKRKRGEGDPISSFQNALDRLRNYNQSLLASRTRLEMAYTLQTSDPIGSGVWAKAALASFTRLGAAHEAAEAAKLLRELGISSRRGARGREDLTQRESEVLALLAAGLSNREIAQRLVISVKTVEHHVSQVLGKTGLRSRAEAAAYVVSRKQN